MSSFSYILLDSRMQYRGYGSRQRASGWGELSIASNIFLFFDCLFGGDASTLKKRRAILLPAFLKRRYINADESRSEFCIFCSDKPMLWQNLVAFNVGLATRRFSMPKIQKNSSPTLTAHIAGYIKWLWLNTPLNQAQISSILGALNQGRVSEVVNGHRFANVQPIEFPGWNKYD